jgi:RimJ/RimL family protein N-acetyltransferase
MDGITVRPVEADDVERLRRLFFRLSPQTVYLRFFQPVKAPSERTLRWLAAVDHSDRQALAAVDADGEIVAVARYDRLRDDPTKAEMAIVVQDDWQAHGLGTMLLRQLGKEAWRNGVTTLTASVLGENRRMLHLAHTMAPSAHTHLDHGELELEIPLGAA